MTRKRNRAAMQWRTMDLHIHTRASGDFQQPETSYLELLQRAEARGLDMIAFTDHNTIAGYRKMQEEINQLELLRSLKRILPEEVNRLDEYRRLLSKILVLPAFEFTATFGFHILGVFAPEKPVREIEHILLDLNIPADLLDEGSATVGATSDVLTAYRKIAEAGGLVIAAHANSTNGVAMRGFNFGGQTKIAYTQDANLHALEVTDLDHKGSGSTAAFFNGTKPEYPRRMHCIQGSDCHRLTADPQRKKNLGIGDRATDIFVPEISFSALYELFQSNDFARTRPHRMTAEPAFDFIRAAREEGANIVQDFHESLSTRGGKRNAIIADACALANTNGGILYIGLSENPKIPVIGISDPKTSIEQLEKELDDRISPQLDWALDVQETSGKKIIRILVPRGDHPPYAVDDNKIYIRSEAETGLAVRDEIVGLVLRSARGTGEDVQPVEATMLSEGDARVRLEPTTQAEVTLADKADEDMAPRTGVEVVSVDERNGNRSYTLRDLRNGNMVRNVTRSSARRLWHYAITTFSNLPKDLSQAEIKWQGNFGLLRKYKQGNNQRFDLLQRKANTYRYYFGVTEDGIQDAWRSLLDLGGGPADE